MAIAHTRALLRAALDGSLADVPMRKDPNFGFLVPESCADDPGQCARPARHLGGQERPMTRRRAACAADFEQNFKEYEPFVGSEVKRAAIRAAA